MPYSGVYVFGDSLVDPGNALKLAQFYGTLTFSDLRSWFGGWPGIGRITVGMARQGLLPPPVHAL